MHGKFHSTVLQQVREISIITGVRFGNVTPCPGNSKICDLPAGLVDSRINSFDAHLQAGSPAIDTDNPDSASADEFDAKPRDARPDIGTYER